jgi:hypothetical protein
MGSEQIPKLVGQIVRNPSEASDARDVLGLTIGTDVLAPNGDGSQLQNIGSGSGDKNYVFNQMSASNTWNITHNLGKYPAVTIVDSAGNVVVGEVDYLNTNSIRVTFIGSFAGKAYLN